MTRRVARNASGYDPPPASRSRRPEKRTLKAIRCRSTPAKMTEWAVASQSYAAAGRPGMEELAAGQPSTREARR